MKKNLTQNTSLFVEEWERGLILKDEWANSCTHGIAFLLSVIGCFFLLFISLQDYEPWKFISYLVYGLSLVILYAASTIYHTLRQPAAKKFFRKVDHCAIYLLIAGSYTPFTLLVLQDSLGWILFGIIWGLTLIGIIFKTFFIHRFQFFSLLLYLIMGWLVVIAIGPLTEKLSFNSLCGLVAGGLFYTVGTIFFALDKKRFFHAIWHLFVAGGSACHYFTILFL